MLLLFARQLFVCNCCTEFCENLTKSLVPAATSDILNDRAKGMVSTEDLLSFYLVKNIQR